MSTFLSKIFKPKWQSKSASARLEAVAQIEPNSQESQAILLDLANNDAVTEVRQAALAKITDTEALIALHHKLSSGENQSLVQSLEQRLYDLANSRSLSIFDLIIDPKLLADMIVSTANPETFINGLARIEDPRSLLRIAMAGKTSRIRQAAAELLESENELKELTLAVKSKDKGVYQIAKAKLDSIRAVLKQRDLQASRLDSLIQASEEHARTDNISLYDSKLESLQKRWKDLQGAATPEVSARIERALTECQARADKANQEAQAAEQAALLEQSGGNEQAATLLTLEETLNRLRSEAASAQASASLDAIVKTQENRWLEATRHSSVDKAQAKQYQTLMGTLRHYLKALSGLGEHHDAMLALTQDIKETSDNPDRLSKDSKRLKNLLKKIEWPAGFVKPAALAEAEKAIGYSQDVTQQLQQTAEEVFAQATKLMDKLDASLDEKLIKQSSSHLKAIQNLLSQMDTKHAGRIQNQLTLRIKQLNELRDWQGYASSPRQQELCELMERLSEHSLPPAEKAEKIKAMQAEWKALGGASDDQLWQRFKTASDKAYEPCKVYYAEQTALKTKNLERRQTLIEQLQQFIAANDWEHADWKAADQINRKAREEWRAAFPVDHKQNRPLQKSFNALLEQLDQHLSVEKSKNLTLKQQVVEKAQALLELDDVSQAIDQAKALQKEWQDIGITEHKKDRALWRAFRKACDAIFDRREQAREARKEATDQAITQAKAFISTMEAYAQTCSQHTVAELKSALDDFRKQNKQLAALPKQAGETHQHRFEALIRKIKDGIGEQQNLHRYKQWQEVTRKAALLRQRYLNADSTRDDALGEEFASRETLDTELETLLKSSWISVKAGSIKAGHVIDANQARQHCIRCEIAAGLDSPESDKELRLQLQVTRLSEGMSSTEHYSREAQLGSLLKEWFVMVGLNEEEQGRFDARISACIDQIFGPQAV